MKLLIPHKKAFSRWMMALTILIGMGAFHDQAVPGFVKKKVKKKIAPRPETWRVASPPIKTPSQSSIVASANPYQQCRATVMPAFINLSMGMGKTSYRAFKALSPPSVLVQAAGNAHPKPVTEEVSKASKDFNSIVVGSMSPTGIKSEFSQEGKAVHIMAPSDTHLTSATSTGHYRRYGGTSGATPLVTGSLAGFEWMAGYHPTAEEAKLLLEKTAIPTPYSKDKPRTNGVGMVNAYKLAMVGKKLKEVCGKNIACFKDQIKKDDIYKFPEEKDVNEAIDKAFPHCSATCTKEDLKNAGSCADKAKAFKNLRKQAFLNPHNKELWKKIACIYGQSGFSKNKSFALNIYNTLSGNPRRENVGIVSIKGRSHAYCKENADCVLVKPCSEKQKGLTAMSKAFQDLHYLNCIEQNGKTPLCNGKCRCGLEETLSGDPAGGPGLRADGGGPDQPAGGSDESNTPESQTTYKAICQDFQCVPHTSTLVFPKRAMEQPASPEIDSSPSTPIGGGDSSRGSSGTVR